MTVKQSKFFLFAALLLVSHAVVHAQLGGLLKSVKDKAKDKTSGKPESTPTNGTNTTNGVSSSENPVLNKKAEESKWEMGSSKGYSSGGLRYDMEMLEREKPIPPYQHIRKVGEPGVFHFAKDYPELNTIADPVPGNLAIDFSSAPFKGGAGVPASAFNSSTSHIYARLRVTGSTVAEVLKLTGDLSKLKVHFYVYPSDGDDIHPWEHQTVIILNAAQIKQSFLDFDIKPSPDNITRYINPTDRFDFYLSQFPFIHSNQFFTKSGNYKIGIKVASELKDDWGNPTGKQLEVMNSFDYTFDVKDAKSVYDEGQVVMKSLQNGIKFSPKPLPKEWKLPSVAPAVTGYTAAKYNQLYNNYYKDVKIIKTYLAPAAGAPWKVIMSNDNVMPSYKYCTQTVFFFVKDASGNCYYHPCDLRQDYTGGGTYGVIYMAVFDEEKVYLNCAEMK